MTTPKPAEKTSPKDVKVKTTGQPVRTVFEGPEEAAKTYVENNFPRVHVNPQNPADEPTPDVVVTGGSGGDQSYWGPEEGWEKA
jgi:hypothetical protein